jgi:hypothetical protein
VREIKEGRPVLVLYFCSLSLATALSPFPLFFVSIFSPPVDKNMLRRKTKKKSNNSNKDNTKIIERRRKGEEKQRRRI